jgi:hypothetical protein
MVRPSVKYFGLVEVPDTLRFLLGTWRVQRLIDDHRSGDRGSFEGTAAMVLETSGRDALSDECALYSEVGELRWGSYSGAATRLLRYVGSSNERVAVNFADGRPFTDLDLSSGFWSGEHLCRSDRYEFETLVRSSQLIEERWRVSGPAKNYDVVTTLTRLS